jgi:hypothetical protein
VAAGHNGPVSVRVQAVLLAAGAFVAGFAVVYLLGHLLANLIVALASVAAGGYAGWFAFRYVEAHGGLRDHDRR